MKFKCLPIVFSFFFSNSIFGQTSTNQIEINSYLQGDSYPSFSIRFNSVTNSTIKIHGISWGSGMNYKYSLKNNSFIKGGLGYHKYSFSKIERYTRPFGDTKARVINYTGGYSSFAYVTDKYWYNTISATVGFEKLYTLKKNTNFIAGVNAVNYFTFSQRYNIPGTFKDVTFKKTISRYFGLSFIANAGLQKNFGRFNLGPTIHLPIFSSWKQDAIFPHEENNDSRSKWLRGIGIGFTCAYPLTKK